MEIGNVIVSSFTACLLLVWCIIALCWNAGAFIMLATLLLYTTIQALTVTDFQAFVICSTLYFVVSATNEKLSKEFQQAFVAFGVVYFIGAIDHFSYSHLLIDTKFDRIQPYLITSINAYVLAYLLSGGRRDNVHGFAHYCAQCVNWYKLHIPSNR